MAEQKRQNYKGRIVVKDQKPFLEVKKGNNEEPEFIPITLDKKQKEVLSGWMKEKKENIAILQIDNEGKQTVRFYSAEDHKIQNAFYNFYKYSDKQGKTRIGCRISHLPVNNIESLKEKLEKDPFSKISAFICLETVKDGKKEFLTIKGANCSPNRQKLSADEYIKKVKQSVQKKGADLIKSGFDENTHFGVFYSFCESIPVPAYDSKEPNKLRSAAKIILDNIIPNQEKSNKIAYGMVVKNFWTNNEGKENHSIDYLPVSLYYLESPVAFSAKIPTAEEKATFGIDKAEQYLESERQRRAEEYNAKAANVVGNDVQNVQSRTFSSVVEEDIDEDEAVDIEEAEEIKDDDLDEESPFANFG